MNKSESIKELSTALNKFQSEVSNPKNSETNAFFKSKYAPLDVVINSVKPILTKNGLSVFQSVSGDGEKVNVSTIITHISGEWIESDVLTLNNSDNKGVSLAQAAGISITYARRYQLSAMLGISSEDDTDGNNHNQQGSTHGHLSEAQVKRLLALGKAAGYDMAQIKSQVLKKFSVSNLEQLSKEQYDTICKGYEGAKK